MKKFFVSLVMLLSLSAASVFAQSSLIATLSHEGEVSLYYGASALQQAHEAAAHGDVITLSSGSFTAVHITKAITLRGAGMEMDTITNTLPTIIAGDFSIAIRDTVTAKLTMEGIYHNHHIILENTHLHNCPLQNATFTKCRFKSFGNSYTPTLNNVKFVHCKIADYMDLSEVGYTKSTLSFINSFIANPGTKGSSTSSLEFINCIIYHSHYNLNWIGASALYNCIVFVNSNRANETYSYLTTANNCIALNSNINPWINVTNSTNQIKDCNDVFITFTGSYTDAETFELTDEAKAKYLGLDGTEVGIYGGNFPFDPKTSAPQITKFNVAAKSTVDGKLSVDIEVKGVE